MNLSSEVTERAVIGTLFNPKQERRMVAVNIMDEAGVTEDTFTSGTYKKCYTVVKDLIRNVGKFDAIAITARLGISMDDVMEFHQTACDAGYIQYHVGILCGLEKRRRLVRSATDIIGFANDENYDADFCIAMSEQAVGSVAKTTKDHKQGDMIGEILQGQVEQYRENYREGRGGLRTHVSWIDQIFGNLQPGRVYLISGEAKSGKTTLVRGVGMNVARAGNRVSVASLEISKEELSTWMACTDARMSLQEFQKANDIRLLERFENKCGELKDFPLVVAGGPMTPNYFVAWARREVDAGSKLIILDYLQAMEPDSSKREVSDESRVSAASKAVLHVALTCNVPVLSIASESNEGRLRYSGQTGYDCAGHIRLKGRPDGSGPDAEVKFLRHGRKPEKPIVLYFSNGSIIEEAEWTARSLSGDD